MNTHHPEEDFYWVGSQKDFVDQPDILTLGRLVLGRFGGNSKAGQTKNEDGCLIWFNEKNDWEFVAILDAHLTAQSAELVLERLVQGKRQISYLLSSPASLQTFKELEGHLFQSATFRNTCRSITGETACLMVARKDTYIWWFSIGDCILYLFHRELAALGQYQVNQRQFYEWIGQVNTFEQEVPCYSSGIKELRQGENHLFLTTDGLIECPNGPFSDSADIYSLLSQAPAEEQILSLLRTIEENDVRDSTTIIYWKVVTSRDATTPSDQ